MQSTRLNMVTTYYNALGSLKTHARRLSLYAGLPFCLLIAVNFYYWVYAKPTRVLDVILFVMNIALLIVLALMTHRAVAHQANLQHRQSWRHRVACFISYLINFSALLAIVALPLLFYLGLHLLYRDNPAESHAGQFDINFLIYYLIVLISAAIAMRLLLILPAVALEYRASLRATWRLTRGQFFRLLGIEALPLVLVLSIAGLLSAKHARGLLLFEMVALLLSFIFFMVVLSELRKQLEHSQLSDNKESAQTKPASST